MEKHNASTETPSNDLYKSMKISWEREVNDYMETLRSILSCVASHNGVYSAAAMFARGIFNSIPTGTIA
jgi:hypothetical protein